MTTVYISIGSNMNPEHNVRTCLATLHDRFGPMSVSPIYQTKAIGFDGDDFLNLVVGFNTAKSLQTIAQELRQIEHEHGRIRGGAKFSPRPLDLDLLLYGDCVQQEGIELPRDEILKYAFVLRPLADIAPELRHPVTQQSYAELWNSFDNDDEQMARVDSTWLHALISDSATVHHQQQ